MVGEGRWFTKIPKLKQVWTINDFLSSIVHVSVLTRVLFQCTYIITPSWSPAAYTIVMVPESINRDDLGNRFQPKSIFLFKRPESVT